ncbi:cytochrome c [Rhodopseudomonas sp. P2A-2r]|uniref:c-type cytochrome n=1 Tax=Rhodopseudomonas sp. P2A-2r TaxID=2991972 RepID=UPI0022349215|nr:cytochrome c [Rhodopseudomonas sp. P2A-2r]UZE49843.1 cytochrome c [Rhodopseudomonas sp. P2A-2r]
MKKLIGVALAGAIVAVGAAWFFFWPAPLPAVALSAASPTGQDLIAKGEYLAKAADCAACHTAPGGMKLAGGLAFKLPFGTIYAPNITPDREFGIGAWSDAEFVRALRKGLGRHGEDLYPAFPYTSFALLSTDDALAIRAYLASVSAAAVPSRPNDLWFPFNQRYVMRGWKLLFMPDGPYAPDRSKTTEWNRGAYLVEALAHCGECHTPRNLLFATKSDAKFSGAVVEGLKAYNITPDRQSGTGEWTDAELAAYLSSGHAEGHGGTSGSMAEAVNLSLRLLSAHDIASMVTYMRTVPSLPSTLAGPVERSPASLASSGPWTPQPTTASSEGLKIFQGACASCHGWDGNGQQSPSASLRGARTVNDPDGTNLVRLILNGVHMSSPTGDRNMPSFAAAYTDADVAAVSNYVLAHFGNKAGQVTPGIVAKARRD